MTRANIYKTDSVIFSRLQIILQSDFVQFALSHHLRRFLLSSPLFVKNSSSSENMPDAYENRMILSRAPSYRIRSASGSHDSVVADPESSPSEGSGWPPFSNYPTFVFAHKIPCLICARQRMSVAHNLAHSLHTIPDASSKLRWRGVERIAGPSTPK